jgi:hypothetical protein
MGSAKLCTSDRAVLAGGGLHLVELARHDRVDAGGEAFEAVARELRRQHLAQPRVVGRVGEAQAAGVLVGGDADGADEMAEIAAERGRRPQHGLGLGVARDDPGAQAQRQLHLADGFVGPELAEIGDGVEPVALERDER